MSEQIPFNGSDFLYARPSFHGGFASIIDFSDSLTEYNSSPNGEIADERALKNDWQQVGHDLRRALKKFEQENQQEKE